MIEISSRPEYDYAVKRGYCPLIDWRMFKMDIHLRIDIQHELFGAATFQLENIKFYHYVWNNSIHNCSETGQPLHNYSAKFVSHIITKGSNRLLATDPRNVNILCFNMQQKWEYGNRKEMNVYRMNQMIINILKTDYQKL